MLCRALWQRAARHTQAHPCSRFLRRASSTSCPPAPDDDALIPFFDRPHAGGPSFSRRPTGLFLQPSLMDYRGFRDIAQAALARGKVLVERILRAPHSRVEMHKVVKNLDRLSNVLCGVIDLAELVRHAHPDQRWVQSANEAYAMLYEYMNVLNTHVQLYEVLKQVLNDKEIMSTLSDEARETARVFQRDFEKSGIHLPPNLRSRFVELSSRIVTLGRAFIDQSSAPRPPATLRGSSVENVSGFQKRRFPLGMRRNITIHPGSFEARLIMTSASDEEARKAVYIASNASTQDEIEVLESLLRTRAQLANLVGQPSFAHMALDDKMTKTPENVMSFLNSLLAQSRPHAEADALEIRRRKQVELHTPSLPPVEPWDREYYCPRIATSPPAVMPTLTPGTVFFALSRLFRHLFGLSLRPADVQVGEVWHEDVRKLEVIDEEEGLVGWIYADLFSRTGKAAGAAHYTVRCSRRTDDDDGEADYLEGDSRRTAELAAHELVIPGYRMRGKRGTYQLPIVALLCDFPKPTREAGAANLEWTDVMTTFHEMGHAIHSMIGRTDYQNVCGTRCATDFVEMPSLLMEHFFLSSPAVLGLFSPSPSPHGTHADAVPARARRAAPGAALDTHAQIVLAALDQLYHSPCALAADFDSTAVFAELQNRAGVLPFAAGTSWQTRFGHLYGYAATYYAYIFDKALAAAVWDRLFQRDPLSRAGGDRLRREVLRFGGGRDPWAMLSAVLDAPELAAGDADAMKEVGRWRIEDAYGNRTSH